MTNESPGKVTALAAVVLWQAAGGLTRQTGAFCSLLLVE